MRAATLPAHRELLSALPLLLLLAAAATAVHQPPPEQLQALYNYPPLNEHCRRHWRHTLLRAAVGQWASPPARLVRLYARTGQHLQLHADGRVNGSTYPYAATGSLLITYLY